MSEPKQEITTAEKSDCLCTMLWIILGIVVVAGVVSFAMRRRKCSVSLSQQEEAEDIDPTNLASINEGRVMCMYHAEWCPHCKGMMSHLDDLARSHDGVRIVKVNAGDGNAHVQKFCEKNGIDIKGKLSIPLYIFLYSIAASLACPFNQSKIPGAAKRLKKTGNPIKRKTKKRGRNQTNIVILLNFLYQGLVLFSKEDHKLKLP